MAQYRFGFEPRRRNLPRQYAAKTTEERRGTNFCEVLRFQHT